MTLERRKAPRHKVMALVSVHQGRVSYIMPVENMSRRGLFLSTPHAPLLESLQLGDSVTMDVFVARGQYRTRVQGRVVRSCAADPANRGLAISYAPLPSACWHALVASAPDKHAEQAHRGDAERRTATRVQ